MHYEGDTGMKSLFHMSFVGFARVRKERHLEVNFLLSRLFHFDHNFSLVCKNWNTFFSYKHCSRSGLFLQGKWKTWALSALAQLCEAVFGGQPWLKILYLPRCHVASTWLSFHKTVAEFPKYFEWTNQDILIFWYELPSGWLWALLKVQISKTVFHWCYNSDLHRPIYLLTVILTQIGKPLETLENIVFRTRIFGTNL